MSASLGAPARRHPPGNARRLGSLAAIPLIMTLLAVGSATAELPSAALRLSAADAARAGSAIRLLRHPVGDTTLVEVQSSALGTAAGPDASLLAVSADGGQAALADKVGELSGSLTIARADGSQLRVQLPGLLGAGFAVDGSWLAVVDGRGALWQVDTATGSAAQLAAGPFIGSPIAAADGSLLLLSVPSVEAPYRSQLVRTAPSTGLATPLSNDELVYAGFQLADGSIAVVAHEPGRTVVRRITSGASRLIADLGSGAINVAVAPDGRGIAYELAGRGIFLLDHPGGSPRSLGVGSQPCFAADASSLLVKRGSGTATLSLDGSVLVVTDRPAGFAGSAGCLP
jgi:hypothetical protein